MSSIELHVQHLLSFFPTLRCNIKVLLEAIATLLAGAIQCGQRYTNSISEVGASLYLSENHNVDKAYLSIWRPISTPVQDSPLALCDYRTVHQSDLIETDIIFPHYADEAYEVLYNPLHRWFYKKNMDEDDMIIFKLDDSDPRYAKCIPESFYIIIYDAKRLTSPSLSTFRIHGSLNSSWNSKTSQY